MIGVIHGEQQDLKPQGLEQLRLESKIDKSPPL
jgi:hypothetical protein